MSYEKQDFKSGDTLYATQLNAMDDQIYSNAENIEGLNTDRHNHDNKTTIDKFSESEDGGLLFNGSTISGYDDTEIREEISGKQETLISGSNIKTINNQSILGEGNINISGGGGDIPDNIALYANDEEVTTIPSPASNFHVYSTEEQIVGYWINGKPIYEITVSFPSQVVINADSWGDIPVDVNDKDFYVNARAFNDVAMFVVGCGHDLASSNKVRLLNERNSSIGITSAILQYTKITDDEKVSMASEQSLFNISSLSLDDYSDNYDDYQYIEESEENIDE